MKLGYHLAASLVPKVTEREGDLCCPRLVYVTTRSCYSVQRNDMSGGLSWTCFPARASAGRVGVIRVGGEG